MAGVHISKLGRPLLETGAHAGCWAMCVVVFAIACAGIAARSAHADTRLLVDGVQGADSGGCESAPCKTLGYAIAQAGLAGGSVTISAAAGTYNEDLTMSSAVSGLTIVGAGSGGDLATSTIIEGVAGASTIETANAASLTLEHLQVLNPAGDNEEVIEAPEASLALSEVTVEQLGASGFGDGINAGGTGPASVTLNGGSVHIAGTESAGYAINNRGGPITVTDAAITVDGTGYGLNAIDGVISANHTQIDMTDPVSSGYGINTYADIHTANNTTITVAGSGLAVNDVGESTLENTTITLTNSEASGYGVNSDGGITAINDVVSVAGSDTGLNTDGNLTITNSTVTLSNAESSEAVFAAGSVLAAGDHVTNAGYGCGIFAGEAMTLDDTRVDMSNPTANPCGAFTGKDLEGEGDEITIAGEGNGEGIGCGGSVKLTDSTILLSNPTGEALGIRASHSANLERVKVTSGHSSALVANGPSVVSDSTVINSGGEPTVSLNGEGRALIRRSTVRTQATGETQAIAAQGLDLVLENSLVLGGCGISFLAAEGETDTLTVTSSTIDADEEGVRDKNVNSITASVDENAASTALVNIEASILLEAPAAKIPPVIISTVAAPAVTVAPGGTGTVTIRCSYTEVPGVTQVQSGSVGSIDCPTGRDGNSFTESVTGIFAHPGISYVLNAAWDGVDSVPAGTVVLPGNLTPSSTDLVGDPRVLNGVGGCLPGLQDKGALELTGQEGIVPGPVISGPESATAGEAVTFTAAASGTPGATFGWQSSDDATGTGATFEHVFQQAGSYTLVLKAIGGPGCTATATHAITVKPKTEPTAPPLPASQSASPQAPATSPPANAPGNPSASQLGLICAKRRLALTDVVMRGGEVLLTGVAEGRFAGKVVEILFDGHQTVASARVQSDGFFSTRAPLPPIRLRFTNRARYVAVVDGLRSLNLKLTRRLVLDPPMATSARVLLSGEVLRPLTRPRAWILVSQMRSNCSRGKVVARVRPGADGHYRVSVPVPSGTGGAVYRLSSRVRGSVRNPHVFRTYSLTEAVQLH